MKQISKRHGCDCAKCRSLCRNEPGWFIPEEISIAAQFLDMPEDKFIAEFLQEHVTSGIIALAPRMEKGACIFLEKGLCKIHPVKPFECRKVYGCEEKRRHKRIREIIIKRWK